MNKKIIIIILVSVVILSALGIIFKDNVIGAYRHQQLEDEFLQAFPEGVTPTAEHYRLPTQDLQRVSSLYEPLRMGNISIPVTFEAEYFREDSVPWRAEGEFLQLKTGIEPMESITQYISDLNEELQPEGDENLRIENICGLLKQAFGPDSCANEYRLYKSLIEIDTYELPRFTPFDEQVAYYQIRLLSMSMQDSWGTYSFEFDNVSGIIMDYSAPDSESPHLYMIELFTADNKMYPLNTYGFSLEEVANLIYSIEVIE